MATPNEIIEGLQILGKYDPKGLEKGSINAEHDIIYAFPNVGNDLFPDDVKRMRELGWHFDEDTESWARFV
jgi:hypothetical protein